MSPLKTLVPPEQIARVDLLGYIGEVIAPAVGDDDVAAALEGIEVACDLGAEEVAAAVRRLVHQHGHALGLHALHDALDRGGAEVVGPGLHGEAEHTDQRLCHAGVDELVHALEHLVGHEVLASAVGLDDRLDEVLGHVPVVRQELLGVLGKAVTAVAERRVVVVRADARLQADAADHVGRVEPAHLAVGVELVEVRNAQGEIGVGEELDCLGLGGAQYELGDAGRSVGIRAGKLRLVRALRQQMGERLRRRERLAVVLGRADNDAARMQVVVKRVPLTQELGAENDTGIAALLADALGVAHRHRRLDDNPSIRVHGTHRIHRRLDGRGVEVIQVGIVVGGCGNNYVLRALVGLARIERRPKLKPHLIPVAQEALNLLVADGALPPVEQVDLLGHHIDDGHLVALCEQQSDGQAHIARPGDGNLHEATPNYPVFNERRAETNDRLIPVVSCK